MVGCRVEGNPLYYLLLLEASATEVVVEETDTCIVEVGVWTLCCWFYLVGVTSPSEGGQ